MAVGKSMVTLLLVAWAFLTDRAHANTSGAQQQTCGDLQGSCNGRICCCSSSGLFLQEPTPQGTCRWQASDGLAGTIFLMAAAAVPAGLLVLLGAFRATALRLKPSPKLAQAHM